MTNWSAKKSLGLTALTFLLPVGLLVGLLVGSMGVSAHRLNLTTTDLVWQTDRETLDVTHQLHLDDALNLLAHLGAGDGVLDLAASARLLNYVEANFSVHNREGQLELEPWGAHIQGNRLFVYQRVALEEPPLALEVRNTLLQDLQSNTRNEVNLRVGDVVRSHEGHADADVAWLVLAERG